MPELTEAEMADALLAYTTMVVTAARVELAEVVDTLTPANWRAMFDTPAESGEQLGRSLGRMAGMLSELDRRLVENWTPPAGRHA